MKRIYIIGIVLALAVLSVIASGAKTNPTVESDISWDSAQTKELFYKACADCHSNQTKWPWYTNVAPVSWFVIHNVNEGREKFNISVQHIGETDDLTESIAENKMPPQDYLLLHPNAKLSSQEKQTLIDGLAKTFSVSLENNIKENRRNDDDDD